MPNHAMGTKARHRRKKVLLERQHGLCAACGDQFTAENRPTFEHIIPWASGGTNALDNLALVHWLCQGLLPLLARYPATPRTLRAASR